MCLTSLGPAQSTTTPAGNRNDQVTAAVLVESGPRSLARRPQRTTVREDARQRPRAAIG